MFLYINVQVGKHDHLHDRVKQHVKIVHFYFSSNVVFCNSCTLNIQVNVHVRVHKFWDLIFNWSFHISYLSPTIVPTIFQTMCQVC